MNHGLRPAPVARAGASPPKALRYIRQPSGELVMRHERRGLSPENMRHLARRCSLLEQQSYALQASNASLARFASEVAHDLRAPLQVIAGFVQLVARREGARLDEVSQGYLAQVLAAVGDMRGMLDSGLLMSGETASVHKPGPADLRDIFRRTVALIEPELDAVGAKLTSDQLPLVTGDAAALSRVLLNLLNNALRYRSDEPLHIHVGARRVERAWEISVTDNGLGVPVDLRRAIFTALVRHSHNGEQGRGLGLAICRFIVERHGGRIWVESADGWGGDDGAGRGSRFAFTIPDPPDWEAG